MKYADILRDQVAKLHEQRDALRAEGDTLDTDTTRSAEELDARADEIIAEVKRLDAEIDAKLARAAELDAIDGERTDSARRAPVAGVHRSGAPDKGIDPLRLGDGEARSRALDLIERSGKFVKDEHRQAITEKIDARGSLGAAVARMALTTHSDEYERGWAKYMQGNQFGITEAERQALARGFDQYSDEEKRNMTSGTGSSGGYLVPVFIDPTLIITGAGSVDPIRELATVKTIGPAFGGWYGASAAQVTAAWTAEGSAAPDNTPTVSQPNIPAYMAEAFVGVSFQAFEDISDLAADVIALFADARANLEADAHATGTGSSQPTGAVTAVTAITASRVSPVTGGTLGLDDVYAVHNALPARFHNSRSLAWVSSRNVQNKIRQLSMAQNSANSVWTDIANGIPATLLSDPIREASSMSTSLTTGQNVLLYGDFSRYYIVDRVGFTTEFIPNLFDTSTGRPIASRGWLAHWRTGANAVDTNAFRILKL